jgi:D-alanyl-D-alanine carboxypeptidase/D-alanyl-D-alanine-endopeptidase (penicillin-binding protein 4)
MRTFCALVSLALLVAVTSYATATPLNLSQLVKNGSVRVETESGKVLVQHRDEELFIPASTMKVATAFCTLEELGREFHFTTEFLKGEKGVLFVRGSGDPSLVSEELAVIGQQLATRISRVDRIVIDTSYFAHDITLDGYSQSLNPYDARNAAFVGNFSSAHITRRRDGSIVSAEPQTPLTPLALKAGQRLAKGKTERINLGSDWRTGALYGGELLAAFLRQAGASGAMKIEVGTVPPNARTLLSYRSTQNLAEIVRGMLKYSTNFTANQVFLVLGAQKYGAPATAEKAQKAVTECLESKAKWRSFHVEEGAGLSRRNQVSTRLMNQLLERFEQYRDLLPIESGFQAKTGTLRGVNTLAGYFDVSPSEKARFSILINSAVPHLYKFEVAKALRQYVTSR